MLTYVKSRDEPPAPAMAGGGAPRSRGADVLRVSSVVKAMEERACFVKRAAFAESRRGRVRRGWECKKVTKVTIIPLISISFSGHATRRFREKRSIHMICNVIFSRVRKMVQLMHFVTGMRNYGQRDKGFSAFRGRARSAFVRLRRDKRRGRGGSMAFRAFQKRTDSAYNKLSFHFYDVHGQDR
jgi:hypothetical protein